MKTNPTIDKSNLKLIGIPFLLLVVSILLSFFFNSHIESVENNYNPFFEDIPVVYDKNLSSIKTNDTVFFSSTIENYAIRDIVIYKYFPNNNEANTKFVIEVYPVNKKNLGEGEAFFKFEITNKAAIYNYKNINYGVFRKPLPHINIEKIIIKQKNSNRKKKEWRDTIFTPFHKLKEELQLKKISKKDLTNPSNQYTFLFKKALGSYEISSMPYNYGKRNQTIYQLNENLHDFVKTKNITVAKLKSESLFFKIINRKINKNELKINFIGNGKESANNLINKFLLGESEVESTFDLKKWAYYFAVKNIFSNNCDEEVYLLYNKNKGLIEPYFISSSCLGVIAKNINKEVLKTNKLNSQFIEVLNEVSSVDFSNLIIENHEQFNSELSLINENNTSKVFDYDIIKVNQRVIEKALDVTSLIIPEIISADKDKIILTVFNSSLLPIDIIDLNYKSKKEIISLNQNKKIYSKKTDTLIIELPRSFENLFVSKKSKKTGFKLFKHIYDLRIDYKVSGLDKKFTSKILPYQEKEITGEDLFRSKDLINNHEDILIDEDKKIITFSKRQITISKPLVILKGYIFKLSPGTIVDIVDGGKIVSHSPLNFIGTRKKPIKIISSDKKGQGVIVLTEGIQSNLQHVIFNNLTNPDHGYWSISGAVTFYESPVNLDYVTISNNSCEDALNIVRTIFEMKNCTISNTQSDGFDGDFVTGTITNSKFNNLGNDAIDVSGSNLKIINVQISNAGDKGLSAGENSKMRINNITISKSEIAVAGKDLSIVTINNLKIENTKLGFTAFQKKPEFGPSHITVNKLEMKGVEMDYLIEDTSSLMIDGVKVKTSKNVKDRMYGVEFGVSSKETRKSN